VTVDLRSGWSEREFIDALIVSTLMVLYCAGYAFSSAIPDTTRDVYAALMISKGLQFPLEGPILGWAVHASPIWYYLLSVPLFAVKSWVAVALFVGLLASFKFVLAYLCGRILIDRRFAIYWAIALAIPGWGTIQQLTFFSPNLVETFGLLSLYLAIRIRRCPFTRFAIFAGIACGIGLNIHPTTLPVGLLPLVAACVSARGKQLLLLVVAFVLAASLPFIPYIVSQTLGNFPDLAAGTRYLEANVRPWRATSILTIVWSTVIEGPALIAKFIGGVSELVEKILRVAFVAVWLVSLVALVQRPSGTRSTRVLVTAIGAALAYTWAVASLRSNTPVYFVYALLPTFAAVLAVGFREIGVVLGAERCIAAFAIVTIGGQIAIDASIFRVMRDGVGTLPSLFDVSTARGSEPYSDVWFPSYAHGENGRYLCSLDQNTVMHGALAYLVDRNAGVDALLNCDQLPKGRLIGQNSHAEHVVGLPRAYWSAIRWSPKCWVGPIGVAQVDAVIWPERAVPIADAASYPPRAILRGEFISKTVEFVSSPNQAVAVTNVIFGHMPWRALSIEADGRTMQPIFSTQVSGLYGVSPERDTDVHWRIKFDAVDAEYVDIVVFGRPSTPIAGPSCDRAPLHSNRSIVPIYSASSPSPT
jgi:hypothetical protein